MGGEVGQAVPLALDIQGDMIIRTIWRSNLCGKQVPPVCSTGSVLSYRIISVSAKNLISRLILWIRNRHGRCMPEATGPGLNASEHRLANSDHSEYFPGSSD